MRIPAGDIERAVSDRLTGFLADRSALYVVVAESVRDGDEQAALLGRAATLATDWSDRPLGERRGLLQRLVARITVQPTRIDLTLNARALISVLRTGDLGDTDYLSDTGIEAVATPIVAPTLAPIQLSIPVRLKRAGLEMRMLVESASGATEPDATLIKLILRGQQLRDRMRTERLGVADLAVAEGVTASYITRIIRLGFLAPDIVTAILNGRQPIGLTANKLANDSRLPLDWTDQRQVLGF